MVAYFRAQNNGFMAAGAALGLLAGAFGFRSWIQPNAGYASAFVIGLLVFVGVILGRILSAQWAKRKLNSYLDILYKQKDPKRFLEQFSPIVDKTPQNTVEYLDGTRHLAYACEALGDYGQAMELMNRLRPETLKLHALVCSGLVANQKLRLYLLQDERSLAAVQLEALRTLQKAAARRAPAVGTLLSQCIRLAEVWLECLEGNREHLDYIREEQSLAGNWIHQQEMTRLLEVFTTN